MTAYRRINIPEATGGPIAVLVALGNHPDLKANAEIPVAAALALTRNIIETRANAYLEEVIRGPLTDAYEMFLLTNGEHADAEDKDEWTSALDDVVESVVETHVSQLGANWLGVNTIDCRLYEEDGVNKFINSFVKEMWRNMTFVANLNEDPPVRAMRTEEILASVGLDTEDVKRVLDNRKKPTPEEVKGFREMGIEEVVQKIATFLGGNIDAKQLQGDIDLASDDDDGLAIGAASRLGIDMDDVEALRFYRMEHGDDTPGLIIDMLADTPPGEPAEEEFDMSQFAGEEEPAEEEFDMSQFAGDTEEDEPSTPRADKPKRSRAKSAPADAEGALPAEALALLRDCTAYGSAQLGAGIGTSRATYDNYAKGKSVFVPNDDQKKFLLDITNETLRKLEQVRQQIEGA